MYLQAVFFPGQLDAASIIVVRADEQSIGLSPHTDGWRIGWQLCDCSAQRLSAVTGEHAERHRLILARQHHPFPIQDDRFPTPSLALASVEVRAVEGLVIADEPSTRVSACLGEESRHPGVEARAEQHDQGEEEGTWTEGTAWGA